MQEIADIAFRDSARRLAAEWIEADVVGDTGGLLAAGGEADQFGRLTRGHCQGFLTEDMLACTEGCRRLLEVVAIGRGEVEGVDCGIAEHVAQRLVAAFHTQPSGSGLRLLRGRSDDGGNLDFGAAERFDMHGADESGTDNGGAELFHDGLLG